MGPGAILIWICLTAFIPGLNKIFEIWPENSAKVIANILCSFLALPIEAGLLALTGTTLGKWIMGISLSAPNGGTVDFNTAFKKAVIVWVKGYACGAPFLYTLSALLLA